MELEWLILADAAQVVGGKLYLIGGGWDRLTVNTGFPVQHPLSIAVALSVPWNETNQRQPLALVVASADGEELARADVEFEVGRPPGMPVGQAQRVQFAANTAVTFPQPGEYIIIARGPNLDERRVPLNVFVGPALATAPRPGSAPE